MDQAIMLTGPKDTLWNMLTLEHIITGSTSTSEVSQKRDNCHFRCLTSKTCTNGLANADSLMMTSSFTKLNGSTYECITNFVNSRLVLSALISLQHSTLIELANVLLSIKLL